MSDSEDDFVEVSGYQSTGSDSEWEKISAGYSSLEEDGEEELITPPPPVPQTSKDHDWPNDLVTSYYQHEPAEIEQTISANEPAERAKPKRGKTRDRKKHQWDKVTLKRGHGAPYDPVEFLGITGGEKALLSHFSITTIGQLAYFNALDFVSSAHPEKFAVILDLQERAYQAVTEYVTKASTTPDVVWGYLYLGDKAVKQVLQRGYLDSDSLYFLWSPMPAVMYRDQLAIDDLVGMETSNRELRTRYSRFVKINLSKLCNKYYGRLYQRDPCNQTAGDKWLNITLLEAAELAQREDMWYSFEPGNEIYSRVIHGSLVIPTGRIPQDCMEMDKENCVFETKTEESESSDDEREEPNPTVAAKLELFY
eukprot:Phypoly_transcript_06875.p1 GENE.Phypoly_transcript_06875~~Phypoly_transcript_06875.p1  ORF type:complete len:366 (+),score=63.36 Phypoly_transcript_06875:318-1415(+)